MEEKNELAVRKRATLEQTNLSDISASIVNQIVDQVFKQPFLNSGINMTALANSTFRSFNTIGRLFSLFIVWETGVMQSMVVRDDMVEKFWQQLHEKLAKSIWDNIIDLRGFWMKLGQFMSTRYDILPEQYITVLSRLQDDIPGDSPDAIKAILNNEYGNYLNVFKDFDLSSLASGSVAQAHKATLVNGDDVAVKILHVNEENTFKHDQNLLENLRWLLSMNVNGSRIVDALSEWQKHMILEFDLSNELNNIVTAIEHLNKTSFDIVIPKPYTDISSKRVLVMEFIHGIKVTNFMKINEYGINITECLYELVDYFLYQMFIVGFFHADPHPGNLMYIQRDGKWKAALIDWGYVKEFSSSDTYNISKLVISMLEMEPFSTLYSFVDLGALVEKIENIKESKRRSFTDPNLLYNCIRAMVSCYTFSDSIYETDESGEDKPANTGAKISAEAIKNKHTTLTSSTVSMLTETNIKQAPKIFILWCRTICLIYNITLTSQCNIPVISMLVYWCKMRIKSQHLPTRPYYFPTTTLEMTLHRTLNSLLQANILIGCQISIRYDPNYYNGMDKFHHYVFGGNRGRYDMRGIDQDTLFNLYSASKAFIAASILNCVNSGILDLDSPVRNYWPSFGFKVISHLNKLNKSLNTIPTIRDVLNHRIGGDRLTSIPYHYDLNSFDYMCQIIANAASHTTDPDYAHITFGYILSRIYYSVTGESHEDFIRSLGISGIKFYSKFPKITTDSGLINFFEFTNPDYVKYSDSTDESASQAPELSESESHHSDSDSDNSDATQQVESKSEVTDIECSSDISEIQLDTEDLRSMMGLKSEDHNLELINNYLDASITVSNITPNLSNNVESPPNDNVIDDEVKRIRHRDDISTFYDNVTTTEYINSSGVNCEDFANEVTYLYSRPNRVDRIKKGLTCVDCANDIYSFSDCQEYKCILMDPRLFDHVNNSHFYVPGLKCHSTAGALSEFYLKLPEIISEDLIDEILGMEKTEAKENLFKYYFAGSISMCWCLGFQVYDFINKSTGVIVRGIGHSDITGTIGMYIPELHVSIGITINNAITGPIGRDILMNIIANHFNLIPCWISHNYRINALTTCCSIDF